MSNEAFEEYIRERDVLRQAEPNRKRKEKIQKQKHPPKIETLEDDTPQQINATPELWHSDSACMSQDEFEEYIRDGLAQLD